MCVFDCGYVLCCTWLKIVVLWGCDLPQQTNTIYMCLYILRKQRIQQRRRIAMTRAAAMITQQSSSNKEHVRPQAVLFSLGFAEGVMQFKLFGEVFCVEMFTCNLVICTWSVNEQETASVNACTRRVHGGD